MLRTLEKGPRKHIFRKIPIMYICFLYSEKSPYTEAAPREEIPPSHKRLTTELKGEGGFAFVILVERASDGGELTLLIWEMILSVFFSKCWGERFSPNISLYP